jgi:phage tail-like protein
MSQMAIGTTTKTGKRFEPYATFNFRVEVDSITEAAFSECSGLEVSNDVFEYQEGGLNEYAHRLPGRTKYGNVTLKRGFAHSNELFDWYKEIENNLLEGKAIKRKQVTISLHSTVSGEPTITWSLAQAIPVKWTGPGMKVDETAVAIETLEFAHHGMSVEINRRPPAGAGG